MVHVLVFVEILWVCCCNENNEKYTHKIVWFYWYSLIQFPNIVSISSQDYVLLIHSISIPVLGFQEDVELYYTAYHKFAEVIKNSSAKVCMTNCYKSWWYDLKLVFQSDVTLILVCSPCCPGITATVYNGARWSSLLQ